MHWDCTCALAGPIHYNSLTLFDCNKHLCGSSCQILLLMWNVLFIRVWQVVFEILVIPLWSIKEWIRHCKYDCRVKWLPLKGTLITVILNIVSCNNYVYAVHKYPRVILPCHACLASSYKPIVMINYWRSMVPAVNTANATGGTTKHPSRRAPCLITYAHN